MAQAAWQVGPLVLGDREWHAELKDVTFGCLLLQELESLLSSIEASWLEGVSVRMIITLTLRLLASTPNPTVKSRGCWLLHTARKVTFKWVGQLVDKLRKSEDEATMQEFQQRVCEMAAICRGTFHPDHADLLAFPEDVHIFVCCAILIYDNSPPIATGLPLYFKRILDGDRRLSHSLEAMLRENIRSSRHGLDLAISDVWPAYRPGSEDWRHLEAPNDHWVTTTTTVEAVDNRKPQSVQYNLINGQLLITGKPPGRLPPRMENHSTYSRVLGRVGASNEPCNAVIHTFNRRSWISFQLTSQRWNMPLETLYAVTRYLLYLLRLIKLNLTFSKVYFSMDDTDLVIRSRCDTNSEILELIPNQKLKGDLPKLLVKNYTHWLDISNGEIELRPVDNPWTSAPQNWRIQFSSDGHSRMHRQFTSLVDIRSSTFTMLSSSLLPLEHAEYMTITYSSDYHCLIVDLPRFRLSFFLNDRKLLESRNWPGMVVDSCQSTGTMFGLKNQLILRPERSELPQPRRVIIPKGRPHFPRDGDHVDIVINTKKRTGYHEYTIDIDLGRLTCKTLESKLFKIYLHAITSHCLPDPLTGRTGTQEALHDLRSAGCKSFQKLEAAEVDILLQIKSLTPKREFYPPHLQSMQTVTWSDLPPLAQHHGFSLITETIVKYAEHLQLFASQSLHERLNLRQSNLCTLSSNGTHLLDRAARRNGIFYPEEFPGPLASVNADVIHASRDVSSENPDIRFISSKVHRWPTGLSTCPQLLKKFEKWGSESEFGDELDLRYSRRWLNLDLAEAWISLYRLCRESLRERDCFRLEFSLSAMAYTCSDHSRSLLPTILAFATVPQFRRLNPPSSTFYDLTDGFAPQREKLVLIVLDSAIAFEQSSDVNLPALSGEDEVALGRRRHSHFVARRDSKAREFVDQLLLEWPCPEPRPPHTALDGSSSLFDISSLMKRVTPLFQSWYRNVQFRDHIQEVQHVLDEVYLREAMLTPRPKVTPCTREHSSALSVVTFDSLLTRNPPRIDLSPPIIQSRESRSLKLLFSEFENGNSLHQRYGGDLESSRRSLDRDSVSQCIPPLEALTEYHDQSFKYFQEIRSSIQKSLKLPSSIPESAMLTAGQWPCVTTKSLLGKLAYTTNVVLTDDWQQILVKLAQGVLVFQRSQRLLRLALAQNNEELYKELVNGGCNIHDATKYPDWLLLQVNISILLLNVRALNVDDKGGKSLRRSTHASTGRT
jgi:hypothetical protein